MKKRLLFFSFFVSITVYGNIPTYHFDLSGENVLYLSEFRHRMGDDTAWADPAYNAQEWDLAYPRAYNQGESGVHWYRAKFNFINKLNPHDNLNLEFHCLYSAYEIYWDGKSIGRNGIIGSSKQEEHPGKIVKFFPIPREASGPGTHTLAIRYSNHHQTRFRNQLLILGYHKQELLTYYQYINKSFLLMGIFLTAVIVSLAMAFSHRRNAIYHLFAAFCILQFLRASITPAVEYFNLNIEWLNLANWILYWMQYIKSIFALAFLLYHVNIDHKYVHLSAFGGIFLIPFLGISNHFFAHEFWLWAALLYFAIIMLIGVIKNRWRSGLLTAGYVLYILPSFCRRIGQPLPELTINITEILFIFSILFLLRQQIKQQRKQTHETELRSQRLEKELLKKSIQPHFIFNTLQSLISWIRENPVKAEELIQALTEEFRIINKIASEKTIPVLDEIELCQIHLDLMQFRLDAEYMLEVDGVDEEMAIPPMIFHTLIENGLTHAYDVGENGTFKITASREKASVKYCIMNDGSLLSSVNDDMIMNLEEGMGFAYIRTRLEEVFPSQWKLKYGQTNGFWEVVIQIDS